MRISKNLKIENIDYILNVLIRETVPDNDKDQILSTIYDAIHDKIIVKNPRHTPIQIRWYVTSNKSLTHYYCINEGMFSDIALYEHTRMLLDDIHQRIGREISRDKYDLIVTKPLTRNFA
jgi:hypothetical protein